MGIVIDYSPAFNVVADAAMQAGYGQYQLRQQDIAREQQQRAIDNQLRATALQSQIARDDQRFRYAVAQDQQQRQDRAAELQFQEQSRLRDMQFRTALDDRNFDQERQMLELRQKREEELIGFKMNAEDEAKVAQANRQKEAIQKADWLTEEQKQMAMREVDAQLKIGPPIPRNMEAQENFNSSMVTDPKTGRRYLVSGGSNTPRFEPMDADDTKIKAEETRIELEKKKADQKVYAQAELDYTKAESAYDKAVAEQESRREKYIQDAITREEVRAAKQAESTGKQPAQVDVDAIASRAGKVFDQTRRPLTPPDRARFFPWESAQQAGGMAGYQIQQMMPQPGMPQQEMPVAPPPPPEPQPPFEQVSMPQPEVVQGMDVAQQERQFVLPDNHPAAPAYNEIRTKIPLGKGDAVNEDALAQDFQVTSLKEGSQGVERLKTELSRASQLIMAVDEGGRKLSTTQELEEFRLAARLLMKYVKSIPRNQR